MTMLSNMGGQLGLASANPAELVFATDRLRVEHDWLRLQLKTLEAKAKEAKQLHAAASGVTALRELLEQASVLEEELDRHAGWEERELFPFLLAYHHRYAVPSIVPSFWVLEKDYQLALLFLQSFREAAAKAISPFAKPLLEEAVANLIQACLILNDHLTMEEQLVYPITEQVLTDLDYFFS
ncbi:hemerythrin domain-containing protein [Paenibacillus oryzisoli]|uniref:hemerythrin domain-containing protein n=1 Tax=Paenibacillus oryzisoli TaxID=1850517 RepID=UPI003D2E319B